VVTSGLRPRIAWPAVAVTGAMMAALLVATIDRYGYHRDELYFRVLAGHPAWGYVDQPPLTPMLAKLSIAVFGDHLWSIRIPSILCALAILLVVYGWQIFRMGGIRANLLEIAFDLACVFPLLLILWMAFFAQFVLPVRTFRDRQRIFDRLITYLFGGHGPALFIENGKIKEHIGERMKRGPGVLWLDSASGAVTRSAVAIRQTLGPGVHFIRTGEYVAGTVDLHIQAQSVGPKESDKPFEGRKEDKLIVDLHLLVQAAFFGKVSDT